MKPLALSLILLAGMACTAQTELLIPSTPPAHTFVAWNGADGHPCVKDSSGNQACIQDSTQQPLWQQGPVWVYYSSDAITARDWLTRANAGQFVVFAHTDYTIPGQFNVLYALPSHGGTPQQWSTVLWVYYTSDGAASADWTFRANTGWTQVLWYQAQDGTFKVLYAR